MNFRVKLAVTASAVGFMSAVSTPAIAQSSSETEPDDSEIVVTAQFREQRLQDTPLAITAVNAETLEARSQTSITDVGAFAPNVNLSSNTALNGNSINAFIRGIGQDDASFALEPGVGIYVDDVYYGTNFGAVLDLVDLNRVEVLRGPQGTLAGKNSLGGSVKLFTARPEAGTSGSLEAGSGSYNRINLRGSLNFALSDSLFARFSGTYDKRDGFFKLLDYGCVNPAGGVPATVTTRGCQIGTQGGLDVLSLRGALRYAPEGSPLEINVSADYASNKSEPPAAKLTFANLAAITPALSALQYRTYVAGNPFGGVVFGPQFITAPNSYTSYENYSGTGNYTDIFGIPQQAVPGQFPAGPENSVESYGFTGTIDYQLSDSLSLKSITAWRKATGFTLADIDGSPISVFKVGLGNDHEQFTQELRLSGKIGTTADFTIGGFYYKATDVLHVRNLFPVFEYDFAGIDTSKNRSVAAFANLELHLAENFNVIGGIRYTDDQKDYSYIRTNANGSPISGIPFTTNWLLFGLSGKSGTFSKGRWDYRIGANYRFSDDLMVYAQVATGYKGGGVNPRPFVADQILPFNPETVTTYELGFKAGNGRNFMLNGAAFYNEYKDIQRVLQLCLFSTSITCSLPVNAGNGRSQGFELEAMVRPVEGLSLNASVGYLDFKYKSINPLTFITLDMEAPFNSEWTASAGIQYEADLGSAGKLTPRVDWTYQSSYYANALNNPFNLVDGRSLFNARLTWDTPVDGLSVSAAVTNLGNKFYYVNYSENILNGGLASGIVGRPREWSVSARFKF